MKRGRAGFVAVTATLLALASCGQDAEEEAMAEGRELFTQNCARCHQFDGEGFAEVYPNLAGNPIVALHDPDPTIRIVLDGSGGMPGFRDTLEADELAHVITFIRGSWGNDAPPVDSGQMR
jgi:mono/diheme cytochrome c family protein